MGVVEMGNMSLVVQGEVLLRMEFMLAWQREARSGGSQFLPAACRLELTGPPADRRRGIPAPLVKTPAFDFSYLTLAHAWVIYQPNLAISCSAVSPRGFVAGDCREGCAYIFSAALSIAFVHSGGGAVPKLT